MPVLSLPHTRGACRPCTSPARGTGHTPLTLAAAQRGGGAVAHGAGERLTAAQGAGRRGAAHLLGDGRRTAGNSASTKQRRRAASSGGVRRAAASSSSKQGRRGLGACRAAARAGQGAAGRPRPSATASTEQDLQLRGQASLAPADDDRRGGAVPPRRRDASARRLRGMAGGLLRAGMRSSSSLLSDPMKPKPISSVFDFARNRSALDFWKPKFM